MGVVIYSLVVLEDVGCALKVVMDLVLLEIIVGTVLSVRKEGSGSTVTPLSVIMLVNISMVVVKELVEVVLGINDITVLVVFEHTDPL